MNAPILLAANAIHLTTQTRIIGGVICLLFFAFLVELVRRHRLQERYTIVWFAGGLALLILVLVPEVLYWLAQAIGIRDTNVALFAVAILACIALILHLTVVVSRLADQSTRLAQELAIERANRQAEGDERPTARGQAAGE